MHTVGQIFKLKQSIGILIEIALTRLIFRKADFKKALHFPTQTLVSLLSSVFFYIVYLSSCSSSHFLLGLFPSTLYSCYKCDFFPHLKF